MTPEFEWIKTKVLGNDEETWVDYWYFVDPCGQVRADIEAPIKGRVGYVADLYWEDGVSRFVTLPIAKSHVEMTYRLLLAKNSKKQKRAKRLDI